jgi:predicted small lipoprotein YifL
MRPLALLLLASALLTGCGLKGPLYLPTPAQKQEMAERKKLLEERTELEKQEQQPPPPSKPWRQQQPQQQQEPQPQPQQTSTPDDAKP